MASASTRLITVDEFLTLEFDPECKAELSNGVIHVVRMTGGGSIAHARVQGNVFAALFIKLRGSGCRPYGPDMSVQSHELSMRLPDVSVFCGKTGQEHDRNLTSDDPKMIVEILSPSTRREDFDVKLPEYLAMPSNDAVLYVDPLSEAVTVYRRGERRAWQRDDVTPGSDTILPSLGIVLTWNEIFGRD